MTKKNVKKNKKKLIFGLLVIIGCALILPLLFSQQSKSFAFKYLNVIQTNEITQILLSSILTILTAGIFVVRKEEKGTNKITLIGCLIITICMISVFLNICNYYKKRYDDFKIRSDTLSFKLVAKRDILRDPKFTFDVKDETLESFASQSFYIDKNSGYIEFGERTISKDTGYRSAPVVYFFYNGKNIKFEKIDLKNDNPFSGQYIWDLNNKKMLMRVPVLLFGKLKPENWGFYIEVRISNKAYYRKSFDKTGKVEIYFNGLEKDTIINDPNFFLSHDYDRDPSPENTITVDGNDIY
jgi:hypothetical protein